ncbi:MAG: hypothetical protein AAB649_05525, partial [Patescibacteria group bacterium]
VVALDIFGNTDKIISETKQIPRTNMFSYTYPDFPFINHHWLSEVIFYQVQKQMGDDALLVMRNMAMYIALAVCMYTAYKQGAKKEWIAYTILVVALAYADRTLIRPELFGFVLFSLLVWFLIRLPKSWYWYVSIPVILVLWINLHLTFVFGVMTALLIVFKTKFDIRGKIVFFGLGALLCNPWGIQGVLYPLSLFGNYGYEIAENQSILFMLRYAPSVFFWYLFILILGGFIFAGIAAMQKKLPEALLLAALSAATFLQIRHLTFLLLVVVAVIPPLLSHYRTYALAMMGSAMVAIVAVIAIVSGSFYSTLLINGDFGWGFISPYEGVMKMAHKILLPGRIFNNFDNAGYVIYGLYPKKKVFVDNRPEAYPASFFNDVYIPLQVDTEVRKKIFNQYDIRTVIFAHTDQTEWAALFVNSITHDAEWKLIYMDEASMLLVKDPVAEDIRNTADWYKEIVTKTTGEFNLAKLKEFFSYTDNQAGAQYTQMVFDELYLHKQLR